MPNSYSNQLSNTSLAHDLVNRLSAESLFYSNTSDDNQLRELQFSQDNITPKWAMWSKQMFILHCGGWDDERKQTLVCKHASAYSAHRSLLRIAKWASEHLPDKALTLWTEYDVKRLLVDALEKKIIVTLHDDSETKPVFSIGYVEPILRLLKRSQGYYHSGKLNEGISFTFPKNFMMLALESALENHDIGFHEWEQGGSNPTLPIQIAMPLLAYAIKIIESPLTSFLKEYFEHQRTSSDPVSIYLIFKAKGINKLRLNIQRKNKETLQPILNLVTKYENQISLNPDTYFPFAEHDELVNYCYHVYNAALIIFLTLTGARISEIFSIYSTDYNKTVDGTWEFKSEIIKTDDGAPALRAIAGLVAEAAITVNSLSYIDKESYGLKGQVRLFSACFRSADAPCRRIWTSPDEVIRSESSKHKSVLAEKVKDFWNIFIQENPEYKDAWKSISPHQFRHHFAEFSLRRFEGDVLEAIRRHFRHAFRSRFTTKYTFDKLSTEIKRDIESSFYKEVIYKILMDTLKSKELAQSPSFVGRVANGIRRAHSSKIFSITDIDTIVEEALDDFESIIAHEYGYCIVQKSTREMSKCLDEKTKTPILSKGCFELCSGCLHYAASPTHKEDIIRIAVSHQNMIDSFYSRFGKNIKSAAIEKSIETVKNAAEILKNLTGK